MKAAGLFCALLIACIVRINCDDEDTTNVSDCKISILKVYQCDNAEPSTILSTTLRNISDDGETKAMDCEADLDEELTTEFTVALTMDKWENDIWEQNIYQMDGNFCKLVQKFGSKAWDLLKSSVEPSITEECEVPSGHYKLEGFQLPADAFDMSVSVYGLFRMKVDIYNENGGLFLCHMAEILLSKN